jgi:DNA-directed RNA polymerase subunit K/omega
MANLNNMEGKKLLISTLNPSIEARQLADIAGKTGNLYKSIAIMSKRANQIHAKTKDELTKKLEEFGSLTDNLEEISENKEQIEISKFYEKMANAAIRSIDEFNEDKIYYRDPESN